MRFRARQLLSLLLSMALAVGYTGGALAGLPLSGLDSGVGPDKSQAMTHHAAHGQTQVQTDDGHAGHNRAGQGEQTQSCTSCTGNCCSGSACSANTCGACALGLPMNVSVPLIDHQLPFNPLDLQQALIERISSPFRPPQG